VWCSVHFRPTREWRTTITGVCSSKSAGTPGIQWQSCL